MKTLQHLLRLDDVKKTTGLGRSAIYQKILDDEFPAPVRLGLRAVAWREDDIAAWCEARPSARQPKAGE